MGYALQKEYNIISLEEVKKQKKQSNLKVDGTEKKIKNNNTTERFVYPITDKVDVKTCVDHLYDRALNSCRTDKQKAAYRDWLLFIIGINVGLRVNDLLDMTWDNVFLPDMKTFVDAKNKDEQKTGKMKLICPNKVMKQSIMDYIHFTGTKPESGEYIFTSGRKNKDGKYNRISDACVEKMIKEITRECGLGKSYGTHSLRKTYAYHKYMMYVTQNDPLALVKVQKDLNHRNSCDTARYLGITREEKIKSSIELGDYWDL